MTTLLAVLLALQADTAPTPAPSEPRPQKVVPLYTNDDLDRVHPYRQETGVASEPAYAPPPPTTKGRSGSSARERGEEYWRKEAARVREKVARLEAQAGELRAQLAENEAKRRAQPLGRERPGTSSDLRTQARIAGLEQRIRLLEEELQDRARRQGALPGWLR